MVGPFVLCGIPGWFGGRTCCGRLADPRPSDPDTGIFCILPSPFPRPRMFVRPFPIILLSAPPFPGELPMLPKLLPLLDPLPGPFDSVAVHGNPLPNPPPLFDVKKFGVLSGLYI